MSYAATIENDGNQRQILIADVKQAHFYALAKRDLYIELPAEHLEGDKSMLGKSLLNL